MGREEGGGGGDSCMRRRCFTGPGSLDAFGQESFFSVF